MEFFNIGLGEMVVIFVIALIIFGPERLPEIGRQAGKMLREFRKMTSEVTTQVQRELELIEEPVREVQTIATDASNQARREVERLQEPVKEARETLSSLTTLPEEPKPRPPAGTVPA
ncbi:MAG TPA: twin-arginine translocase subunit TatB, partial [Chloroflexi bacterium]|nr:twin-arginine translocase subunit TatB [Chloroflexota bacterium]